MMISPEGFIEEYKNMSYLELHQVRENLIKELHAFEGHPTIRS